MDTCTGLGDTKSAHRVSQPRQARTTCEEALKIVVDMTKKRRRELGEVKEEEEEDDDDDYDEDEDNDDDDDDEEDVDAEHEAHHGGRGAKPLTANKDAYVIRQTVGQIAMALGTNLVVFKLGTNQEFSCVQKAVSLR
jgi:hypothetical protein